MYKFDLPIYSNFDIAIRNWDGSHYPTHVLASPAGEVQGVLSFANVAPDVITNLVHLRNLVLDEGLRAYSRRHIALVEGLHAHSAEVRKKSAKELGELLFDALMSGEVRSCFDVSRNLRPQGLRIRLRIGPPELAMLPWELMGDRRTNHFLVLSIHTPVVRYFELQQTLSPLPVTYPLHILVVVASPRDLATLDVETEKAQIARALHKLEELGLVKITVVEAASLLTIQKWLRSEEFHVFHYIGHGHYSVEDGEGYLAFENDDHSSHLVNGRKLGSLLQDEQSLRLVILNACSTGQQEESDSFSGVASAIVQAGIPAVVAMQSAISDQGALQFSQVFYEALADGYPIDAAVAEGRRAIDFAFDQTLEWAIPQLFMRTNDGVLFDLKPPGETTTSQSKRPGGSGPNPSDSASAPEEVDIPPKLPPPLGFSCHSQGVEQTTIQAPHPDGAPQVRGGLVIQQRSGEPQLPSAAGMILVPASDFVFGQGQQHRLPDFYIDIGPVTNQEYWRFVQTTGADCPSTWPTKKFLANKADHPVTGISWHEAVAYAAWVGKRLPTQAEWEKAARGRNGLPYPWGNEFDRTRCNTRESGQGDTTPVGFFANDSSPYGVRDLIGNVWEWTVDEENARGLGVHKTKRIVKGGAWTSSGMMINCVSRSSYWPEDRLNVVGFRCVRSPSD